MSGESTFRGICEFCTAFSYTCFLISLSSNTSGEYYGTYIASAVIVLFTWLANCEADKNGAKLGIQSNKSQRISRFFVFVSKVRYIVEKVASYLLIMIGVAYLITLSNTGEVFTKLVYYEIRTIILGIMSVSYFLFICSVILIIVQNAAVRNNPMNTMLQ